MAGIQTIRMNYRALIERAGELDAAADKLEKSAVRAMDNSMQILSAGWTGENARAFLRKEDILKNRIRDRARLLRRTSEELRQTAEAVYKAEMHALELLRKSGS